ncbi:MAG: hypothetical protein HY232_13605 [Acidobacteria bacterium]|nr:hypothetical protein [Acidobacteriota bacterium]
MELKEDPKEWRKSAWLSALGVALLSTLLCWRGILPVAALAAMLTLLAIIATTARLRPTWFRGCYQVGAKVGFYVGQFLGCLLLGILFLLVVTPLGVVVRLMGNDPLRLKRTPQAKSYWHSARNISPMEHLF